MNITRRQFMVGCSTAIAAMAGARLTNIAFASLETKNGSDNEILVVVFLRGGWDALNVIPPIDGTDRGFYERARPTLHIPTRGQNPVLRLNDRFGFHPALAPLHNLYQAKKLTVIHAVGLNYNTRSHFDAMEFIERGTPGSKGATSGWLTRHLASAPSSSTVLLPTISAGNSQPTSLLGNAQAVVMNSPVDFTLIADDQFREEQRGIMHRMYEGDSWLHRAGLRTLDAIQAIENTHPDAYSPSNGAIYPEGEFGESMKTIAQMIKSNIGLRTATVDLGGWDTHEYEGEGSEGYLAELLAQFARGLAAFYADLDGSGNQNYAARMTVVVMSEFGRRLVENASHGTDHGHGSAMLVLGGNVNGCQVFGAWPGLQSQQLFERQDLAVTTDYRQVLSEILIRRLGNSNLSQIFPGYSGYKPMGIVQGTDLPIR